MQLILAALACLSAQETVVEFTVAAGKHDRMNVPVSVPISGSTGGVTLQDAAGKAIPAQIGSAELHFILPSLKAGETAAFKAVITKSVSSAKGFRWVDTAGEHAELRYGDRPVMRYMYKAIDESSKEAREQTYKVYHHVFDPSGARLVTKGPGGQFTHHRGLFYGFKCHYGDKKVADTWHCTGKVHLAHEKFLAVEEGPVLGRHRVQIRWHGVDREVIALEERELTAWNVPGGIMIDFASLLRSKVGPLRLDGDPQHAGFHFRADNEVSAKTAKQTYYVRPDGNGKPGETRNYPGDKSHVNLPWNAMSFLLGEKRYTVAYLDRQENPKEARFSERDYGRFGSYFVAPVENGLAVRYRVWLQEGEMKGAEVAAKSADFTDPPKVAVK